MLNDSEKGNGSPTGFLRGERSAVFKNHVINIPKEKIEKETWDKGSRKKPMVFQLFETNMYLDPTDSVRLSKLVLSQNTANVLLEHMHWQQCCSNIHWVGGQRMA